MGISSFPNGFAQGVSIRGVPVDVPHPGQVFWVNNSSVLAEGGITGSNGNDGTYRKPFSTIDYAIGKCKANRGDVIYVMPGHSETIVEASAIDFDVAGVKIVGLGHGSKMSEIEFNHASATVAIGADNVVIENMRFNASITTVGAAIIVEDGVDYAVIRGCMFDVDTAGTDEFTDCINFVNDNSYCVVEDNVMDMGIAAAVSAVHMDADTAFISIRRNVIRGDYSTACIRGDTTLSTNVLIEDNLLVNGIGGNLGTEPAIELLTGTHGIIRRNDIVCNLATKAASIVANTCFLFENYYNEDVTGTGGIIGTASADD